MKLLTKEVEDAHNKAVLQGVTIGGIAGLIGGWAGVLIASKRWAGVRNLTLPMKAFLVTSTGTFTGIVAADHGSRSFERSQRQDMEFLEDRENRLRQQELAEMSIRDRVFEFARREKYKIVGLTWIASMAGSFALVSRSPYLSGPQKIVQARVYAQGLTLAVLCATAAFEISDQRKGRGIADAVRARSKKDKNSPDDLWKDMVDAEEHRMHDQEEKVKNKQ
ncbi:Replication factor C, subunit RFC4 [Microsporum canis]|uniref:Mitochondrial hypoxia responsive domain-containing protein n=1 Tax=Arthroderma otae (strain ATCC MYA-4605 / CBS 113480) TaxID=554155 RepID=C5FJT7_ARTOC|nr:mitochondrial hypoxia responsive domain-containing protein [Microsporum canis CBS 113480]EEQ30948.1 mitochondrial hypoxia responsive domain-containing protein [Microsporum canis CBS 113480]